MNHADGKRAHLFVIRLIEEELHSIDVSDNARPKVLAGDVGKLVKGLASNWNWEGLDVAGTQHQKGRGGIRRFWAVVNPGWSHRCTWQRVLFISVNGPAVKQFWYITYTCFNPSPAFSVRLPPPPRRLSSCIIRLSIAGNVWFRWETS